jgi:membrane protein
VLFIIFFSSNAVMGIMRTFDRSYYEVRSKRFMAKRWSALKLTFLILMMVVASILLLAMQGSVKTFVLEKLGWNNLIIRNAIEYSRWLVIFALFYFAIASIYHYGPAVHKRWGFISPGAVVATLLVIAFTALFSVWVNNFGNYNKIYGSIGTVIILMNLIYVNALILIVGFELNVSITAIKAKSQHRRALEDAQAAD